MESVLRYTDEKTSSRFSHLELLVTAESVNDWTTSADSALRTSTRITVRHSRCVCAIARNGGRAVGPLQALLSCFFHCQPISGSGLFLGARRSARRPHAVLCSAQFDYPCVCATEVTSQLVIDDTSQVIYESMHSNKRAPTLRAIDEATTRSAAQVW